MSRAGDAPGAGSYGVKVRAGTVEDDRVSSTPEETYGAALLGAVPAVAGGLAAISAGYALLHPFLLDGEVRWTALAVDVACVLVFVAVLLAVRWRPVAPHLAHPLVAVMLGALVAAAVSLLVLVGQPRQSTNLMLVLVGAGALLLSLQWLLAVLCMTWGAWLVGAFLVGPSEQWPHYAVGMLGATVLAGVVSHLRRSNVRRLAQVRAAAEASAVRDHLTGVANRRGLAMVGTALLEQARRQGDAVHAMFVDIDGLKRVNDALGHAAGDEVIVAVAEALRSVTRATDVVARWGGDEFCVVGPGPGMPPLELERRIRDSVAAHSPVPADVWPATVSAGGAMLAPWDGGTLETLLGKADQEMYLRRSLRREESGSWRIATTGDRPE